MQQLWECPKCGVIVKVTEVMPPLVIDAEKMIERKLLKCRISGLDKIMRRFRLGLPFLRLGCWLADMELEVEESPEPVAPEIWRSHESQKTWPVAVVTLEELDEDFRERRYAVLEDYVARLKDLDEWQEAERERLANLDEGEQEASAEPVLGGPGEGE